MKTEKKARGRHVLFSSRVYAIPRDFNTYKAYSLSLINLPPFSNLDSENSRIFRAIRNSAIFKVIFAIMPPF